MIDFKQLVHKLTTPRSGFVVVKLTTTQRISLFVKTRESQSQLIELGKDQYVAHLEAGDILVQGHYKRNVGIYSVNDLDGLNGDVKIMMLGNKDDDNKFIPLTYVPQGWVSRRIDRSLTNIVRAVMMWHNPELKQGASIWNMITVHPVSAAMITYGDRDALRRHTKPHILAEDGYAFSLGLNHSTGALDVVINSELQDEYPEGVFIPVGEIDKHLNEPVLAIDVENWKKVPRLLVSSGRATLSGSLLDILGDLDVCPTPDSWKKTDPEAAPDETFALDTYVSQDMGVGSKVVDQHSAMHVNVVVDDPQFDGDQTTTQLDVKEEGNENS